MHIFTEQVQSTPSTASSVHHHTNTTPLLPRNSAIPPPRSRSGSTSLFKRRSGSLASPTTAHTTTTSATAAATIPHVYDAPGVPVETDLHIPSVPTEGGGESGVLLSSYIRICVKDTGHGISQVSVA